MGSCTVEMRRDEASNTRWSDLATTVGVEKKPPGTLEVAKTGHRAQLPVPGVRREGSGLKGKPASSCKKARASEG